MTYLEYLAASKKVTINPERLAPPTARAPFRHYKGEKKNQSILLSMNAPRQNDTNFIFKKNDN